MHAYLLVGGNEDTIKIKALDLAKKQKLSFLEFPLAKIEDVRNLNRFTRLSLDKPTAIYIKSIDKATLEALNAFLKSLEEPQEQLVYLLSASSIYNVLPTIVSRCQILKVVNHDLPIERTEAVNFSKMTPAEKLIFITNLRKRDEAEVFLDSYILYNHDRLLKTNGNWQIISRNLDNSLKAKAAIKANGNVLLQLTSFVISLV